MKEEDLKFRIGHRERLRQKFLDGKLADYEILELLLSYAIPRRDVRPLARGLMQRFGSLYQIFTASMDDLLDYKGLGKNTAVFIKAIQSIMISSYKYKLDNKPIFHDELALTNYCKLLLGGKTVEEFHIFYLDAGGLLLKDELHSTGTIDWAIVYPREIVKQALLLNAKTVLLLHNHPVPCTAFSSQDIEMTEKIKTALETIDVVLFDHFIVSGGIIYSAKNMFLLK